MKKTPDEERIQRIVELAKQKSENEKSLSPKDLFDQLDALIIGNNNYKKSIAIALADFLKKTSEKNHLLVVGPSGSGKTYLLEKALPTLKIPFYIIDCASLVPSGYKGKSLQETIEFFLNGLPANTKNIIILDEFDKISTHANGGDDFKSQSLQSELLILLSGASEGKMNTKNTLWILAGAFAYAEESKDSYADFNTHSILK